MLFLLGADEMGSPRSLRWVFKEALIEQRHKNGSAIVWKSCGTDEKRLCEGVLHNSGLAVRERAHEG